MMVAYRVCVNSPSIPINPFMVIMSKVPIVRGFLRLKASKLLHVRLRSVSRSSHASDSTGKQRTNQPPQLVVCKGGGGTSAKASHNLKMGTLHHTMKRKRITLFTMYPKSTYVTALPKG